MFLRIPQWPSLSRNLPLLCRYKQVTLSWFHILQIQHSIRLRAGCRWRVAGVRTGVRALPPRDENGSLPLAGRLGSGHNLWVVAGLGARGLVYHAWLGALLAKAVLSNDASVIPEQLQRWRTQQTMLEQPQQ